MQRHVSVWLALLAATVASAGAPDVALETCETRGDATCLVDDPPGLLRAGDGRFARGSSGPANMPGRVIAVTSASGGTAPGSLRGAYAQIAGPTKIVLSASLDGQDIVFPVGYLLKWDKPYTTLDCSLTSARLRPGNGQAGSQVIAVGATHDVILYGCGAVGYFNETRPQVPGNNMTLFGMGNFIAVRYPWDDLWDSTPAALRGTARKILFDRIGCSNAQDDCGSVYEGATDVSILRSLVRRSWHPSTAGAGGYRAPSDPKARRRVTYAYDVWYRNGARQIRARYGIYDWRFVRNVVADWVEYKAPPVNCPTCAPVPVSPNSGLWLEDDVAGENDLGYIVGNLGIAGAANPKQACIVGGKWQCDACGTCAPGSPYAQCNPKMATTRWWFAANTWDAPDCHTNPPAWSGVIPRAPGEPPLPKLDEARPWAKVLAEVGPPKRRLAEQADIDWIAARVPR